jgi:hypothetical protein
MPEQQKFSHYLVSTGVVTNSERKRSLMISIGNMEDSYDGLLLHLSPGEAKILSKAIYDAARAMEQQPKGKG